MSHYKKQAKIEALNKEFPGMNCGNPRCEELCAEVLDAAKDMRLDPAEAVRKTIEQELGCRHAEKIEGICRFGFTPKTARLSISAESKKDKPEEENAVTKKDFQSTKTSILSFNGKNECQKQLDPSFTQEKNEQRNKKTDVQKQITSPSEHIPERQIKEEKSKDSGKEKQTKSGVPLNRTTDETYEGKEVEFRVAGAPGRLGLLGGGRSIDGFEEMLNKLEKNNPPHSIGLLRIIGHGSPGNADIGVVNEDSFSDLLKYNTPSNRRIIERLKNLLSTHAILELRMCNVGNIGKKPEENGSVFAQKLANLLWCRVKVYLEPVNAYGLNPNNWFLPSRYEIYQPCL